MRAVLCLRNTPWMVLTVGLLILERRLQHGLWFPGFADENMSLLGGRVLNAGGLLYRDFVDNHGPVLFMLTSLYGKLAGWMEPNWARLMPAGLILLATASVAGSPALSSVAGRLWGAGLFAGMIGSVWLFQGLYLVNYYSICGSLIVVTIALFAVPTWLNRQVPRRAAWLAGLSAAFASFGCYCFAPTVLLFMLGALWSGFQRRRLHETAWFMAGGTSGSIFVLFWLLGNGDIVGYFAFHIALSQTAYKPFVWEGWWKFRQSLSLSTAPSLLMQSFAVVSVWLSALLALVLSGQASERRLVSEWPACVIGLVGIMALNARGSQIFVDGTFLMAAVGLLATLLACMAESVPWRDHPIWFPSATFGFIGMLVGVELAAHHAQGTPVVANWQQMKAFPPQLIGQRSEDPISQRIRALIKPDETFLALVYKPESYFGADRLPMSGFYEYLPWDAAYAHNPWFGMKRDLCQTLRAAPPPVILFDNWKVWNKYSPSDYMPCLFQILAEDYKQADGLPGLYVRPDRLRPSTPAQ